MGLPHNAGLAAANELEAHLIGALQDTPPRLGGHPVGRCTAVRRRALCLRMLMIAAVLCTISLAVIVHAVLQRSHSPDSGLLPYPYRRTAESDLIRGVSLGGWLLVEPFITPSLFDRANVLCSQLNASHSGPVADERSIHSCLGRNGTLELLRPHWETFVTRNDLDRLQRSGINTLRVPVPYWMFDVLPDEPWVGMADMQAALRRVMSWAVDRGLKIFVDLHGAPGGQNGFDNSGQLGARRWAEADTSGHFNIRRTLHVWRRITEFLVDFAACMNVSVEETLAGVEVVNEAPCFEQEIDRDVLRAFIVDAYFVVRGALGATVPVFFHDCFYPHAWTDFMRGPLYHNVYIDRHEYQVFDVEQNNWPREKHLQLACEQAFSIAQNEETRATVVGEFSAAVNDCDWYVNGYGQGSRYEGTPPYSNPRVASCAPYRNSSSFTTDYIDFLREFAEKQMLSWDIGHGWIFWNFKTEHGSAPHFDYLLGIEMGYLPPRAGYYKHECPDRLARTLV